MTTLISTGMQTMTLRAAALALLAALLAVPLAAQTPRVLMSDASGVTIEYRPQLRFSSIAQGGSTFSLPDFDGAIELTPNDIGAPGLRYHAEVLALPGLTGNTVAVLQTEYEDRANILLAPIPSVKPGDEGSEILYEPGPGYAQSGLLPGSVVSLGNVGIARDRIIGSLRLFPFQYDAPARRLRLYTRIVVRVDYGPADARLRPVSKADGFAASVLNADMAARALVFPRPLRKTQATGFSTGNWYRIEIPEEGVYRLTRSWFQNAGIDVASLDPRTIKIFTHGGRELPASLRDERPEDMQEIAIEVSGENDGRLDDGDEVLFFAQGLTGFTYDSAKQRYRHYIHRYDNTNACLLTFGGATGARVAQQQSLNEPSPFSPQWFTGKEFSEEEAENFLFSGKNWFGKKINPSTLANSQMFVRKLEGLVRTEPVVVRLLLLSQSEVANTFSISDGTTLGSVGMGTIRFSDDTGDIAATSGVREFSRPGDLPDDRSSLRVEYSATNPEKSRGGYVDWIEWYYARRFVALGDALAFSAPDTAAVCAYDLNGFSTSDLRVYDVSDFARVRRIADPFISGGTVRFQAAARAGRPPQYLALARPAFKTPGAPVKLPNSDLMTSKGAEYVIITAPGLVPAANTLKQHRERAGDDALSVKVVTVPEIYNEFNNSVADPAAIRNFLAHALANWEITPRYVLLFGDGHYDPKGHSDQGRAEAILVPVWETENTLNRISCYVSDDYFAQLVGDDAIVDLATGRLPVQTLAEAEHVVSKIIAYETHPDLDPWKNRITLVADDGLTTSGDDRSVHTAQSELLSNNVPLEFEQRKIYIVSYKTENTAQGRRKPEANKAIIDQINEGTLLINWTGHGSDAVWAHENIFVTESTVPQLVNDGRQTFVTAATCTFGLYDRPGLRSGTEAIILHEGGGAIGALSSVRVVFSGQNSSYNQAFFTNIFTKGREPDGRAKRIGDGNYTTKLLYNSDANYEKFHLFADPAMRLALPRYRCSIDSFLVNGNVAAGDTLQLKALSTVTIKASVVKPDSSVWTGFNGVAQVALYDASRRISVPLDGWSGFDYGMQGGLLYRGQATIANGMFTVTFMIPKDISYENSSGRLAVYFDNSSTDGSGFSTSFRIGGSDTSASDDNKGPDIALFMDTRSFLPGDVVNENPLLIADLFDEHGINTTGLGIGHNIEAWLDGSGTGTVLNAYYKGERDSYQRGTVQFRYAGLASGTHTLRFRAWDIFNNPSIAETHFRVEGSASVAITDAYPYPNPMQDRTVFTFTHNQSGPVRVEIKIYSVAGRLIRSIQTPEYSDRNVHVPWDGRDEDGTQLANGTYFYKIVCTTTDGGRGSELLGKLAVLR
ncbi:MAG: type IX secretion system sortase PorU [Ignavibacteria bacterium]|nr:type IX secretion system sortase PorU [Ignavibacteria bacterium]